LADEVNRVPVFVVGGFRRGTDIFKALYGLPELLGFLASWLLVSVLNHSHLM
jgi:hypothetical protein